MSIFIHLYKSGAYRPGNFIEGVVVLVLNTRKNIRGIRLKLIGREYTSWEKRESYYDNEAEETKWRTVNYSGDNKFLMLTETLPGGTFNLGRHEYPFIFTLPNKTPSTYKGSHGFIVYYLEVNADIPTAPDYETQKIFTVMSHIDFNDMSHNIVLNPSVYQDETTLCCCCCASDPLTADAYFEKEAFVLGEIIQITLRITNMSNTSISETKAELKRTIKERCTTPESDEKIEEDVIVSIVDTGVGAHGERSYNLALKIPETLDLPNFTACALFSQKFLVKIVIVIPGCHSNMEMIIPVKLGHVGFGEINTIQNEQMQGTFNTPVALQPPAPLPDPYNNAAPSCSAAANSFPVPPSYPGTIGFSAPGYPPPFSPTLPGVHQAGYQAPYPPANAPSDPSAPSAPSKTEFDSPGDNRADPPPSYYEAMKTSSKH